MLHVSLLFQADLCQLLLVLELLANCLNVFSLHSRSSRGHDLVFAFFLFRYFLLIKLFDLDSQLLIQLHLLEVFLLLL